MNIQAKFETALNELSGALIERDTEIELAIVGLIAGENVLFVGPPGTAKSLVADSVARFVSGRKFSALLGKFSTPDEVFGPVSITGLKAGTYERLMDGYLPKAHVSFLDEIFKGSSAILNSLLNVLNERVYVNGSVRVDCDTRLVIAASNESTNGDDNSALYDRFLLRKFVSPVSQSRRRDLLLAKINPTTSVHVTPEEIDAAREEAGRLEFSADALEAYDEIISKAEEEKIFPGDRRLRKSVNAVRAFAWLQGSPEVLREHLEILAHCLWTNPEEQPQQLAKIVARVANPPRMVVAGLLCEAHEVAREAGGDLGKQISAKKKIEEISRKLAKIDHPRSAAAAAACKQLIKDIALKAVSA